MIECRCSAVDELYGTDADEYVTAHLVRDETRSERFEELYVCPDTGRRWLLDYPERTESEPGPLRLRTVA
jgi:hypothetical protein